MVSTSLAAISRNQNLWKMLCFKDKIDPGMDIEYTWDKNKGDKNSMWKLLYINGVIARDNWVNGKYQKKLIPLIEKTNAISCFINTSDYLAVGTRKGFGLLYEIKDLVGAKPKPDPIVEFKDIHKSSIVCIATLENSGNIIVTGDSSGMLAVWNIYTGEFLGRHKNAHSKGLTNIAMLSPEIIITSGFEPNIKIFSLERSKSAAGYSPSASVNSLVTEEKEKSKVSRLFKKKEKNIDPQIKVNLSKELIGHKGEVYALKIICNNRYLVSGGTDNIIKVWDMHKGTCMHAGLRGHLDTVTCFANHGNLLFSGSLDREIIGKWRLTSVESR
jgi:WD40 repeat protein